MRVRAARFTALLLLLLPAIAHAQATSLKGRFQDPSSRSPVPGVQVKLTRASDSTAVHRATAREDGTFEVTGLTVASYRFEATRVGYAPLRMILRVTKKDQDAGVLGLMPESVPVSGITVSQSPPAATQKGDTTEYRAGAVKTHRDATAEDLVQKLPGVTMEGGQIRAQGEQVQQVLVNGRPFFGSDPTAGMRNLPAEVVDRVQVYDRMSDQASFSGFDDGQSQRTMNFILRDQKAQFGSAQAGYGDQDRYQAGGNATVVRGGTRLTALAMSNNINQRNFSPQDLFGALGGGAGGRRFMMLGGGGFRRGGGGGQSIRIGGGGFDPSSFLIGQQNGVSTTHSGGLNYAGQPSPRLSVSSSLFLNHTDTDNLQTLARQYLPPQDSLAFYDQSTSTDSRNGNQRFDARVEWTLDSLNSIILQPRLYFQNTETRTAGNASNRTLLGSALGTSLSDAFDANNGNNLSNRLTLRHRFAKRGRNVTADVNVGHTSRDGTGSQRSLTDYVLVGGALSDTLDQRSTSRSVTNSFSTRVAFTEPIGGRLQGQILYEPSLTRSESDARGLLLDPLTGLYSRPDSALSNSFESRSTLHNGGLAALYTRGAWRLLGRVTYQHQRLRAEQTFPLAQTIDRTYGDVLPFLQFNGTFARARNLRLTWYTSTTAPSISQLQNVVNNSNPLALATGNPGLQPTYSHTLAVRFSQADPARSRSRFLFMNVTRTSRPIANSSFTAATDTTLDGIFLVRGTQLTKPVNLHASWNGNLFALYSRPLTFLKSIVSVSGGGTWTRTPTRINEAINVGSAYAIRSGAVLSSNISQNLDFTVSYWSTYNISRNTLSTNTTGDYFTHSAGLRLNSVIGPGIVVRQEVNHNLQSGVPSAYGQDIVLWNTTLGKKFLKDQRGEFRITTSDVLKQNRSVNRSITEAYVEDTRDRTLGRYVQAVFTYTFRGGSAGARGAGPTFISR